MTGKTVRAKHNLCNQRTRRAALLTIALLLGGLVISQSFAADPVPPPSREDVANYLEWYKRNGLPQPQAALRPSGQPRTQPIPIVTTIEVQPVYEGHPLPPIAPPEVRPMTDPQVIPVAVTPSENPTAPPVEAPRLRPVPPPPPRPLAKEIREDLPRVPEPAIPAFRPAPLPVVEESPRLTPFEIILFQVGCTSCGKTGGTLGLKPPQMLPPAETVATPPAAAGPTCSCGSGNACVPGRHGCSACEGHTRVGRFLCALYECICCPDPCYEPKWFPLADSAFFVDSVRPQTQQRMRWDMGRHMRTPDRAEYFWARSDGRGKGPNPTARPNALGLVGEPRVRYHELSVYTEGATGNIGAFVEMPYRSLDGDLVGHAAGFSDMNIGTKTLLFDCELLQLAFVFRTYLPIGNFSKGLGTGHVSLEPGLILGLKVGPDTFFQGELLEWIPLGGDPDYQGAMLHYHASLNHVLCRILPDVPLIGTVEFNGWSFQDGLYTDPVLGSSRVASGGFHGSLGPGLRLFICDKIDFGMGMSFAISERRWTDQLYRSEFRYRF